LHIPAEPDHSIRLKPITESGASRSLNPVEADQRFRTKPISFGTVSGFLNRNQSQARRDAG
jgi:hypothetical protein